MNRQTPVMLRMIEAFFRHLWLFLITLLVVSSVTITFLYFRSKQYIVTAKTRVEPQNMTTELGMAQQNTGLTPAQEKISDFTDLVNDNTSGGFLDRALNGEVQDLQTKEYLPALAHPFTLQTTDPRFVDFNKKLSATPVGNNVFAINLQWDDPEDAKRIVARLQNAYIITVGQDMSAAATGADTFLTDRITKVERKMKKAEDILIDYKKNHSGELPVAQANDINQLESMKSMRQALQLTVNDGAMQQEYLIKELSKMKRQNVLEQTTSQSPYEKSIDDLYVQKKALLAKGWTEDHPEVQLLTHQIEGLRKAWNTDLTKRNSAASRIGSTKMQDNPAYEALQSQIVGAKIDAQSNHGKIAILNSQIAELEARVVRFPDDEKEFTNKTRDYNLLKSQYEDLKKQQNNVQLQGALSKVTATSTLKNISEVTAEPMTGKTKMWGFILGAILLGILIGLLFIVLSEWMDPSLRYAPDAERLLGVPVLASLPESRDLNYRPALTDGGASASGQKSLPLPKG